MRVVKYMRVIKKYKLLNLYDVIDIEIINLDCGYGLK